jgi:hypothetical protein
MIVEKLFGRGPLASIARRGETILLRVARRRTWIDNKTELAQFEGLLNLMNQEQNLCR